MASTQEFAELSENWPTIFELASQIPQIDLRAHRARGAKNRPPVTQGLIPEPFPTSPGYVVATPEQLASLRVPKIEVNGSIKGFQREKVNSHARNIAKAMVEGEEMPPIIVSIFPDGKAYVGEGQHRALGALIARKSLEAVVKQRTIEQARKLFANQSRAKNLKADETLLSGDSELELYIQDAVTSETHPWSQLVSAYKSDRRMTPTSMANIVGAFAYNSINQGTRYYTTRPEGDFNERAANQLAELLHAFGNKTTNPLAFRAKSLRAIGYAAVHVFRRNPNPHPKDHERWMKHMPMFDFGKFPHMLNKETELGMELVKHWNKRLPENRKVNPVTYT